MHYLTLSLGHPYEPILAVSGIDHTIKIFSPDNRARQDAEDGVNISQSSNDSSGYRSAQGLQGLSSRKRMEDQYTITNYNDADRRGGMRMGGLLIPVGPNGGIGRVQVPFTTWLSWFTS